MPIYNNNIYFGGGVLPNTVVDLFCGVGGLTHGLQLAGLNVVAGIDIEDACRFAYEANNNALFVNEDITKITSEAVSQYFNPNGVSILVGCAPCQPFSRYSSRYRKNGRKDDKWRLLSYFQNIARQIMPDIISIENVPSLRDEEIFINFVNELEQLNYHVFSQVVNCPDYGVPQKRKRLVMLASRFGNIQLIAPIYRQEQYRTVRMAISNLPPIEDGEICETDSLHRASKLSDINKRRIIKSLPGGTWRDWDSDLVLDCHKKNTGKTFPSVYGRMEWDKPSPTITTQFYGYGNGRFGHPEQNRAISLREGAILQSFPADYIFCDTEHKISKRNVAIQIGNAVPVALGEAIGKSIIEHLIDNQIDFE